MSFLDKPLSELTTAELQKLISDEVARQTPAIPSGVLALLDSATPVTVPATQDDADVLTYDASKGSYIAAPVPSASPVTPPQANTPVVAGGVGYIVASWTAVTNDTPVDYDVYMDTNSGFTPGPGTFIATTPATMLFIRATSDGTKLDYDATYYVVVIARSDTLSSTQSVQSAGVSPVRVDHEDIAVNAVHADTIDALAVTTGKLDTAVVLSGLIQTAETGARIVIQGGAGSDGGITLYQSDGETIAARLPTDGSTATFNGNVVTGGLIVTDTAVIQGANNYMDRASVLTLTEKLGDPGFTPLVTANYDMVPLDYALSSPTFYQTSYGTNYTATGGAGGATPVFLEVEQHINNSNGHYAITLREYDYTTGASTGRAVILESGETFATGVSCPIGACKIGSKIYAFTWHRTGVLFIWTITASTFAIDVSNSYSGTGLQGCNTSGFATLDHNVALGSDGTNPWLFSYTTATKLPNRRMVTITSPSSPTLGSATDFASGSVKFNSAGDANNPGTGAQPVGIAGAAWDPVAGTWYVAYNYDTASSSGSLLQKYKQSDSSIVAKQEIWQDASEDVDSGDATCSGLTYDGTNYWWSEMGFGSGQNFQASMRKLTNLTWDYTLGSNMYIGTSWVKDTSYGTVSCGHDPVASVAYVGNRGSGTVDGTFALTWTATTTGTSMVTGNRAILGIVLHSSDNTIDSVTGGGVTWVQDGYGHNTDGEVVYWFSAELPSGLATGTTLTIVEHAGGDVFEKRRWSLMEVSGITAGPPGGTHTHGSSGTSTTPSPGATSGSANSGDFAVSGIAFKNGSVTGDWTATSGWTKENTLSANSRSGWFEYKILASSGAVTGNVTTTLTAIQWAAAVVYYTQAGGGSSPLLVHAPAHGLVVDQEVYFTNSGGALPTGLSANTPYYVISTSLGVDDFKVSATRGGTVVNTTGTDSGTTTLHIITETKVSPRAVVSLLSGITAAPQMRQKIRTMNAGVPSAASAVRTYAQVVTAVPATTALRYQSLSGGYVDSETAAHVVSLLYNDAGNAPNPTNNFPGASPASITASATAATAAWKLQGDGVFRVPTFTKAQRLATPTTGDMHFDTTTGAKGLAVYDGSDYVHMPKSWYASGGEGLRDAMFALAAVNTRVRAQNFPMWGAIAPGNSQALTNQRLVYLAVYWPGGSCTGIDWIQSVVGSYTDSTPHSGVQLLGGSSTGPLLSTTTTVTRITGSNATSASIWKGSAGHRVKDFTGGPITLAAGIYYVNLFWFQTANTTSPELSGMAATGNDYVNDASQTQALLAPVGFPLVGTVASAGDLLASDTIATWVLTTTNVPWVGLH
jgi:hypothetical protein